jgi:hypothetical protein
MRSWGTLLKSLGVILQGRYRLVEGAPDNERRVCSYDMFAVPDPSFVLKDMVGEMYFCNLRCFCVWSVQLSSTNEIGHDQWQALRAPLVLGDEWDMLDT